MDKSGSGIWDQWVDEVEVWGRDEGKEKRAGRADGEVLNPRAVGELIYETSRIER